ncbi:peptidylprolyl isomerase [Litorimonas sp. RW-G-Af-16]|uniref:peptidylprolyl isomerase n=1 Tax=Litorimonas sp. RW-G-Af-16 TaxID=3241168 RepID=UPI003AAAD35B
MMKRIIAGTCLAASLVASACAAEAPEAQTTATTASSSTMSNVPAEAWRTVDPDNLMVIDTAYGKIGVELFPEIAPAHVSQIKALVRQGFYDGVPFHRVIDGFMNQTGDGSNGDGTGDSDLPNIPAEFTFRRGDDMAVTLVGARKAGNEEIGVGFYKSLPVATQPISQAMLTKDGKVAAFGLHCKGVTSMARTSDPNSANSQFFLMRAKADHLDTQYSVWGNTVMGYEYLESFKVGTKGEVPGFIPDQMNTVTLASDIPDADRPNVQVLKVNTPAFSNHLKTYKNADGTYPDICDITVPSHTL